MLLRLRAQSITKLCMTNRADCINSDSYSIPDQVIKNVETVIGIENQHDRKEAFHVRFLQKVGNLLGTASFLYIELLFFAIWTGWSHLTPEATLPFNIPKYNLDEHLLDTAALLIATGVLVYQTRREKLAEQRSHLILQINLLTEQKTTKLIELVEKLRADLPVIQEHKDLEAELMQQTVNPQDVLDILQKSLEQADGVE